MGVGDPSTPGYAAKSVNTTRVPLEDVSFVPKIPSLPISWQDAQPFMKATEQFGVVSSLCDADYFSGPSNAVVNLVNINEDTVKPIWNVIGTIKGITEPNRTIIIGNHRDAWGYGAVDPSSGSAVMVKKKITKKKI
jgi:N-acetylated-alpha-linked acidic dipeptidase